MRDTEEKKFRSIFIFTFVLTHFQKKLGTICPSRVVISIFKRKLFSYPATLTDRLQTLHCLLGEVTGILLDEWGGSGEVLGGMLSAPEHLGRYVLADASGSIDWNLLKGK